MKRLIKQSGNREIQLLDALIKEINNQSNGVLTATGDAEDRNVILKVSVADDDINSIEEFLDVDVIVDGSTTKLDQIVKNICKQYIPGVGVQKQTVSKNEVVFYLG